MERFISVFGTSLLDPLQASSVHLTSSLPISLIFILKEIRPSSCLPDIPESGDIFIPAEEGSSWGVLIFLVVKAILPLCLNKFYYMEAGTASVV
jgi:hypothetical protein